METNPTLPPFPLAAGTIPLSEIIVPPRLDRQHESLATREANTRQLADSIQEAGLIQPIVLKSDRKTLAVGATRVRALALLGYTEAPYNVLGEKTESELLIVQFEENAKRSDIPWQGKICMIAEVHFAKVREGAASGTRWTQKATGQLTGVAEGHINDLLKVHARLVANDPEIITAPTQSEAIKRIYSQIEQRATEALAKHEDTAPSAIPIGKRKSISGPLPANITLLGDPSDPLLSSSLSEPESGGMMKVGDAPKVIPLSERLFQGKMEEFCGEKSLEGFFDLIFTDIPYGADMAAMGEAMDDIDKVANEHDFDTFLKDGPGWFQNMYKVLKDRSYALVFYDPFGRSKDPTGTYSYLTHDTLIRSWATDAGFRIQRTPTLWHKMHPCTNKHPQYYWTNVIENVLVLRKGTASLRNTDYAPNIFQASTLAERKRYQHPFCKPFEFVNWVLDKVSYPGMLVYDPFAGEGSILRACVKKGLIVYGSELSETWFPRLQVQIRDAYSELYGNVEIK
jgi:ParB-like chromosome segregation protein Spo0J/DNA modification methylase